MVTDKSECRFQVRDFISIAPFKQRRIRVCQCETTSWRQAEPHAPWCHKHKLTITPNTYVHVQRRHHRDSLLGTQASDMLSLDPTDKCFCLFTI